MCEKSILSNDILFEDNHLIVLTKSSGILSQADKSCDLDMVTLIKDYIKKRDKKPGKVYLGLVHRLDRNVGGVMVFAKTSKCASRLSEQIRNNIFKKYYYCILTNMPKHFKGTLKNNLFKDKTNNLVTIVEENIQESKVAVLNYEVVGTYKNFCKIWVELITGRSHQIRVQFANIGCPILNDSKYGQRYNQKNENIFLWSNRLMFNHPISQKSLIFEKEPPDIYPWRKF